MFLYLELLDQSGGALDPIKVQLIPVLLLPSY
jgi:hypothetical protein